MIIQLFQDISMISFRNEISTDIKIIFRKNKYPWLWTVYIPVAGARQRALLELTREVFAAKLSRALSARQLQ